MAIITDDMISDRITRKDMLPLSFLKKSAYTGSKRRFNYKLEKTEIEPEPATEDVADLESSGQSAENSKPEADIKPAESSKQEAGVKSAESSKLSDNANASATKTVLRVYWWTGLRSYDVTPENDITSHDVEFSDAGIDEAIAYLNETMMNAAATSR